MKRIRYSRLIGVLIAWMNLVTVFGQDGLVYIKNTTEKQQCQETPYYIWKGQYLTTSGTYSDTVQYASEGTPGKIDVLKLTFTSHVTITKYFQIHQGSSIVFRGKTYDTEGTFTDSKPSITGCDTTYKVTVTLSEDYHFYETKDICNSNTPYTWRGGNYSTSGEYLKTYRTKDNKHDSIYHLILRVHMPFEITMDKTVCEDALPFILGTQKIYTEGLYHDTVIPSYGCMEISHVNVHIRPRPFGKREVTFCADEGYLRDSVRFYDQRTYYDTIPSLTGCDSIVETTYRPLSAYRFETKGKHLPGEGYTWAYDGKTYFNDTICYYRYSTREGCDSVYVLYLKTAYEIPINIQVCQGDEIYHHDKLVTEQTEFPIRDTMRSILGGDSVLLVTYQFMPRYYFIERTTMCKGDTAYWRGHTDMTGDTILLKEAGSYYDRKKTQFGCDSIYEMQVTLMPKYTFDTTIVACNDEMPYIWTDSHGKQHEWWKQDVDTTIIDTLGHTPTQTTEDYLDENGVWYRALAGGCDSIWQMRLIVKPCGRDTAPLCPGSAVWVNNVKYTNIGDYRQCVRSTIPPACDSICRVHIYPAEAIDFGYYPVVECCASALPYKWYNKELSKTGKYDMKFKTVEGCDSIVHIDFVVLPTYKSAEPTRHICRGDTTYITRFNRPPIAIWKDTTFRDTMLTQYGCDSILIYTVDLVRDFYFDQTDHFRKDSTYWWHRAGNPIAITKPGVYFDSCRTIDGCDSIYRLTLRWDLPRHYSDSAYVCANDLPYKWHNKELFSDTFVIDSMKSPVGMDSVFEFKLKVLPKFERDEYISLCSKQTYTYREHLITQSGTYIDTLVALNGCDSIIRYHINFMPDHLIDEKVTLGAGHSYTWPGHGLTVSEPGWYYDSLTTLAGCDSIYRLHVIKDQSFLKDESIAICAADTPYLWHGQLLSTSGVYYDRYEVRPGVDSTYAIHLTVKPTYLFESTVDLCAGGTHSFFGRELQESGVYEEQMTSTLGCDSIYRVTINRLPSNFRDEKYTICLGETITIADTTVSQSCQFLRTYPSAQGCDSTVRFLVNALKSFKSSSHTTICKGQSYTWKRAHRPDTILRTPGVYKDIYPIANGCDSVFELALNVEDTYIWDTLIYVCSDESYFHKGKEYTASQEFRDTFINQYGCDSIRIYHYKVMQLCSPIETYFHCKGTSIIIGGRNYVEDGDYRILINKDSLHRFTLAAYPTYERNITLNPTCDSLEYAGTTYYARVGSPTFVVDRYMHTVKYGCDSIEHVTMTIYKSVPPITYEQTIYDYSYVVFGGEYYNTTGTYVHNNKTITGCDSIVTLKLHVLPTDNPGSYPYFYCALSTKPINIFGKNYRPQHDTTIIDTTFIPFTDLKIIKMASVTVEESFTISNFEPENDVCATQDVFFTLYFTTLGGLPSQYEFEFLDNDITAAPKRQTGTIDPLHKAIEIKMLGQGNCVSPGIYPYRLRLNGNQCHLSDTILQGEIMVRYPASVMQSNWDNVVTLYNETKNAGAWIFEPPYQWQVWSSLGIDKTKDVAPTDPSQPYIYSNNLSNGDSIMVTLKRQGYKYAIPSCKYTFQSVAPIIPYPILVTPTVARKASHLLLQSNAEGQYRIYDSAGNLYQSGSFHQGEQSIKAPSVAGCYFIQLMSNQQTIKNQKIIIY